MRASSFSPWIFPLAVTIVYGAAVASGMLHHELWLDETHHWLLAKYSASFGELLHNARYEGHPLLWNLLLYAFPPAAGPGWMQLLNLLLASAAVLLFVRYAPFPWYVRLLAVFSYFVFYEYGVISRNYALAFLLLTIVCIAYRKRREHFVLFCLLLFLLANTHLFATAIAGAIFLVTLRERFKMEGYSRPVIAGALVFISALVLVAIQAWPQRDHFLFTYHHQPWLSGERIGKAFAAAWKGFFALPDLRSDYPWNTNQVIGLSKKAGVVFAALAWLVPFVLIRRRTPLFIFWLSAALITGFLYASPLIVAARHCGFLFLLLVTALWIADYYPEERAPFRLQERAVKWAQPLLLLMLFVQLAGGIFLYVTDWKRPFSQGKAVAGFIQANDPSDIIVVNGHYAGPPVCAFLGREVYYAEYGCNGSFCRWSVNSFLIPRDTLMRRCNRLLEKDARPVLLVANEPLGEKWMQEENAGPWSLQQVAAFTGSLVKAEDYWVYELKRK